MDDSGATAEYGARPISPKSYGVAVTLSGIFGVVGVHHFYLGNWLHGVFDFGLFVVGIACLLSSDPTTAIIGVVLLTIDVLHTIVVTYRLFVGLCKDGNGQVVAYPGQFGPTGSGGRP